MPTNVFANNNEVASKASDGKSIAAFPDVCFSPPAPPVGPIPLPYPNTGEVKDTDQGTAKVFIKDKMSGMAGDSCMTKSMGDDAATQNFNKGMITGALQGKCYFALWSMNVNMEGKGVPRHMDMVTHNHGSTPTNTPPWPELSDTNLVTSFNVSNKADIRLIVHCSPRLGYCGDSFMLEAASTSVFAEQKCKFEIESTNVPELPKQESLESQDLSTNYWKAGYLPAQGIRRQDEVISVKTKTKECESYNVAKITVLALKQYKEVIFGDRSTCYTIELNGSNIIISVKIYFNYFAGTFDPTNNSPVRIAKDKEAGMRQKAIAMLKIVERFYNNQFKVQRENCKHGNNCKCIFNVVYKFSVVNNSTSPDTHTINLYEAKRQANAKNLGLTALAGGSILGTWAHEIGHVLGYFDEYEANKIHPTFVAMRQKRNAAHANHWLESSGALMDNNSTKLRNEYLIDVLVNLKKHFGMLNFCSKLAAQPRFPTWPSPPTK